MSSRKSVVLPAPFGPSTPQIWPAGTWSVTPVSAGLSPNDFATSSISTSAGDALSAMRSRAA